MCTQKKIFSLVYTMSANSKTSKASEARKTSRASKTSKASEASKTSRESKKRKASEASKRSKASPTQKRSFAEPKSGKAPKASPTQKRSSATERKSEIEEIECLNDLYKTPKFSEYLETVLKDQVAVYMNGCFCPPHKGHYDSFVNAITEFQPALLLISTTNYSANPRHGTPLSHTIETLKRWGKVLKKKYGVEVLVYSLMEGDDMFWYQQNFPKDVLTKMIHYHIHDKRDEEIVFNRELPKKCGSGFWKKVHPDKRFEYHALRPENSPSATKFTACLKSEASCHEFVPTDEPDPQRYIQQIRALYATALHGGVRRRSSRRQSRRRSSYSRRP